MTYYIFWCFCLKVLRFFDQRKHTRKDKGNSCIDQPMFRNCDSMSSCLLEVEVALPKTSLRDIVETYTHIKTGPERKNLTDYLFISGLQDS